VTRDSTEAHLSKEARSGVITCPTVLKRGEVWGRGTRDSAGAHLRKEVRSGATGHVAALKPTSAGMCDLKLQLIWHRVDTRPTSYLNLKFVYRIPDLQGADSIEHLCVYSESPLSVLMLAEQESYTVQRVKRY
jgi:hypothetical protein